MLRLLLVLLGVLFFSFLTVVLVFCRNYWTEHNLRVQREKELLKALLFAGEYFHFLVFKKISPAYIYVAFINKEN